MSDIHINMNGARLCLDRSGAAFWPEESVLIFSDLHFEKGSSFARRGQFLPPYDTRATLMQVAEVIARYRPRHVIALGDSFHDAGAADRLSDEERATLRALGAMADWIWITGNHDPSPPAWLSGQIMEEFRLCGLVFRHEPSLLAQPGEVAGHLHPCATVTKWGRSVRRRCFVSDGVRLLLPSFGAYTGGLDVRDGAIAGLFERRYVTYMLGASRVYAIAA